MTLPSQVRQPLFGLVRLYAGELRRLRGVRRARWVAWSIAIVALVSMLARFGTGSVVVLSSIEALGWLSWLVGGAITWSAVRNWQTFQEPLADMARERGLDKTWRDVAAPLALTRQLVVSIGLPALLLTAFAVALDSGTAVSWVNPRLVSQGALLVLVPSYVLVFAVGLALLVYLSTKLCPEASAMLLLILLVVPHACRELWPYTPSVIGFYEWLWSELFRLGATA